MNFGQRVRRRCEAENGFNHKLTAWTTSEWLAALLSQVGDVARTVTKMNRDRDDIKRPAHKEQPNELRKKLADQLADVSIYLDLMAQAAGFDLEAVREARFVRTSEEMDYFV